MKGLFIFAVFITAIYFLLRYLRQREVEAFRNADMSDFRSFRQVQEKKADADPLLARAKAFAALNPGVVVSGPEENQQELTDLEAPDTTLYVRKESTFDEVTRNLLQILSRILPQGVTVLTDVALSEFARSTRPQDQDYKLTASRVSYLICDSSDMSVICGIHLQDRSGTSFIKGVFSDIGLPLLELPVSNNISEYEVREQLDPIVLGRSAQVCPRCGEGMTIRTAVKGKNAGSIFWVCSNFPSCRGVVRA